MKRFLIIAFQILLLGSLKFVSACSCGGYPAVCESFAEARAVFVGTVRTVENKTARHDNGEDIIAGQKAWVTVDKVFKGKVTGELLFRSYGSSCDPVYKEGQRWLFYAYFNEKEKAWQIQACDRSTLLDDANDDLSYLDALPKSAQTTRISGRVEHFEQDPVKGFSLVKHLIGNKVTISGPKNYEVFTDSNGVFEVYGAPPGLYEIKAEMPMGMKLRFPISFGPTEFVDRKDLTGGRVEGKLRHKLEEKGCVSVEFVLSADNSISGKVIGANGTLMPRVCLELIPVNAPERPTGRTSDVFDCTEADGSYKLDQMPPGEYLIVANFHNKISSDEPFPPVYYPGTFERKEATVITMALGDRRTDYNINIPKQFPTHLLSGVLLFADGKPLTEGFVEFEGKDVPAGYDGETHVTVDSQGRFELPVLAGLRGSVRGYLITWDGQYINCPKLDQILRSRPVDISSELLPIEVNSDRPNIELRLPFPSCVKAKKE